MTLLSLICDNPKFKALRFNKDLNVVVGKQLNQDQKDTINGIGKSLSLEMLHYMLNAGISQKMQDFLKDYGNFKLSFVHDNKGYVVEKNFKENEWIVNDKSYNKIGYANELNKIFSNTINSDKISFRQVFNCFARRSGHYDTLRQQNIEPNDYGQRLVNLFLLGVDIKLQEENHKLKETLNSLKIAKKELEKYEKQVPKKNIKDIEDEIRSTQENLKLFVVAKNYNELKERANSLTEYLNNIRNEIYRLQRNVAIKEANLLTSENISIDLEEIKKIYDEAKIFFEDKILKRLDEAQNFHNQLAKSRKDRISAEIDEIRQRLNELERNRDIIGDQRDQLLKDLKNSGALEERDVLKDRILTLEKEKKDLEIYSATLENFQKDKANIDYKIAEIKKNAVKYMENDKLKLDIIENKFRDIVKRFYNNNGGSLKITMTQNAKNLFNIDVEIPKDGSLSIGNVKTFCYDVLLYTLNPHILGFLAHDGELFSEMDKRQKATIFKIILDKVKSGNLQYFVNIGDTSFNEILNDDTGILSDEDKKFIESKVILQISEDPHTWLFGQKFD
ncbi:DUF2326 domain-containing protein [Campylobacter hyointestinalis]|uniref:DUF2326 domain-containing protein n=1 Tax=Campylobacter hyointestinalis TaxID=198 RepID=UPI001BD6264E|nr:DUF2326 domain-containing protein [Campylobacter hyointestinalis]MBT0611965.1 DUF2326 domain-containing protein [Campylobacter hyointestinalis subsp. hyointestinalis]MDY2999475.1 DUF2326 domain-containing protein [Campylobacter hyointestinalis]